MLSLDLFEYSYLIWRSLSVILSLKSVSSGMLPFFFGAPVCVCMDMDRCVCVDVCAGDYLAQNCQNGEQWPIPAQKFEQMYELCARQVEDEDEEVKQANLEDVKKEQQQEKRQKDEQLKEMKMMSASHASRLRLSIQVPPSSSALTDGLLDPNTPTPTASVPPPVFSLTVSPSDPSCASSSSFSSSSSSSSLSSFSTPSISSSFLPGALAS